MKKLFYLAFCAAVLMSLGCATISYPVITDDYFWTTVNTNGKAHVMETTQVGLGIGGKYYEQMSFVDQAASGYQHISVIEQQIAYMAGYVNFHSDTYCNPDWNGCAWYTNDYMPITDCTFYGPNSRINWACFKTSAYGLCYIGRTAECGRGLGIPKDLRGSEIVSLIGAGIENGHNMIYNINNNTTRLVLQNPQGAMTTFKFAGNTELNVNLRKGTMLIDGNSPNWAVNVRKMASLFDAGFQTGTAQLTIGGVTRDFQFAGLDSKAYLR